MLTKSDELMCHQIVSTFDCVVDSNRNWTEKTYFEAWDKSGKAIVCTGIGKYPNRNVMDGYASVALMDRQYTVHSSRELAPDRDAAKIGPISYEVVEPLKSIRLCLGKNDYGISFDLVFEGTILPMEEPEGLTRIGGQLINHTVRYYQMGVASGKIMVEGKTYEVKKDSWECMRDHSWGIRALTGGMPEPGLQPMPQRPGWFAGIFMMEFKDYCFFDTYSEDAAGNPMKVGTTGQGGYLVYRYGDPRPPMLITKDKFRFEFFPGTRHLKSIEGSITLADGTTRQLSMKSLGIHCYGYPHGYLAGYKGRWQGKWMGPFHLDGEMHDLADKKVVHELLRGGSCDVILECRCGDDVGYGVFQYVASGELPLYGIKKEG